MTTCLDAQHRYMVIVRQVQEQRVLHVAADIADTDRDRIHPRPIHHLIHPRQMAGVVAVVAVHLAAQSRAGLNPDPLSPTPSPR